MNLFVRMIPISPRFFIGTEKMEKEKKNKNHKADTLPAKYTAGFLAELDGRTKVFELLREAHSEILQDLGGENNLSHVQRCLVERFVFLEMVLRNIEAKIATNPKESAEMLSRWIQGLNSLSGLAKTIGLSRKGKKIASLQTYIRERGE